MPSFLTPGHKLCFTLIQCAFLHSPTGASVTPASSTVPHQAAASGEECAVTSKVVKPKEQPKPMEEYAMVDKSKKTAANPQGVSDIYTSVMLCVYVRICIHVL